MRIRGMRGRLLGSGIVWFSAALVIAVASEIVRVRVVGAVANVRSGPGKTSTVLFVARHGDVFDKDGTSGDWCRVVVPAGKPGGPGFGYIHRSLAETVSAPPPPPPAAKKGAEPAPAAPPPRPQRSGPVRDAGGRVDAGGKFSFSLLGGAGVTIVDLAKDLDVNPNWLLDWNKFHWRAMAVGVYRLNGRLGVGASAGFHSLYYYWWKAPYFTGHEGTVTAWSLHGVLEFRPSANVFLQAGPGVFLYPGNSGFGVFAALGVDIPLGRRLAIPLLVRFDEAPGAPSPLALLTGIRLR